MTIVAALAAGSACADEIELILGTKPYRIELAVTVEQRRQGLMHRKQLDFGSGMLLVYPRSGDHRIWMKNMVIPLRVFWIDARAIVVGEQRIEPCSGSPCAVYSVDEPTRYVLELSDHDHDLKLGDRISGLNDL